MTMLRAVIVDDEEPARELLRSFLAAMPEIEVAAEASDGQEAVEAIARVAPDVVFLDVQMPRMNGFDVVAALPADRLPIIVFVTAYDQYALRAFEVSACDYLLKPFDAPRLQATVRRVVARHTQGDAAMTAAMRALLDHVRPSRQLVVKSDGRHVFVNVDEIEWLEAVGKEVRLHVGAKALSVREPLSSLEARLDASRFLRVHRSAIVNRAFVKEMQPWFKGDYVFVLRSGARVVSGRTYRATVQRLLG